MQVELLPELLSQTPRDDLLILSVWAFAALGRHRVLAVDKEHENWQSWFSLLPPDLADDIRCAQEESERREAVGVAVDAVRVGCSTDARARLPRVTLRDALLLLGRPLRVLLENGRNDRSFVLAFADEASRTVLENAEREGWLVFESAGGISELAIRAKSVQKNEFDALRLIFLCDSDQKQHGKPSEEAAQVKRALNALRRQFHRREGHFGQVLSRRAAENYAPPVEVVCWAKAKAVKDAAAIFGDYSTKDGRKRLTRSQGRAGSPRRMLIAALALKELSPDDRSLFDMKEGRGPQGNQRTDDGVWDKLTDFQKAALADGFGKNFGPDFYNASKEKHLQDETGEVAAFINTLIERL